MCFSQIFINKKSHTAQPAIVYIFLELITKPFLCGLAGKVCKIVFIMNTEWSVNDVQPKTSQEQAAKGFLTPDAVGLRDDSPNELVLQRVSRVGLRLFIIDGPHGTALLQK